MKKQFLSAAIITVFCSSALAGESVAIPFNYLDSDSDNTLSRTEVSTLPEIAEQWNSLDKDGDGKLSRDEYGDYKAPATGAGAS